MNFNFCSGKDSEEDEKTSDRLGENICRPISDKWLVSTLYKELSKLSAKKENYKWSRNMDISPEKIYRWQINIWKDSQHHESPEKYKLYPQDITIQQSEWIK